MKQKIAVIGGVVLVATSVAYFLLKEPAAPPAPVPSPNDVLSGSRDQIQKGLQDMLTKKAEEKSLQTQLAVYEKMLTQFPDNTELRRRADVLRQRLQELK